MSRKTCVQGVVGDFDCHNCLVYQSVLGMLVRRAAVLSLFLYHERHVGAISRSRLPVGA